MEQDADDAVLVAAVEVEDLGVSDNLAAHLAGARGRRAVFVFSSSAG